MRKTLKICSLLFLMIVTTYLLKLILNTNYLMLITKRSIKMVVPFILYFKSYLYTANSKKRINSNHILCILLNLKIFNNSFKCAFIKMARIYSHYTFCQKKKATAETLKILLILLESSRTTYSITRKIINCFVTREFYKV